jgi:hypothetical protein
MHRHFPPLYTEQCHGNVSRIALLSCS